VGPVQGAHRGPRRRRAAADGGRSGAAWPAARRGASPGPRPGRGGHARRCGGGAVMGARVTVYTREGCHLCEEAVAVIKAVCEEVGEAWEEIDVEEAVGLPAHYDDEV